MNEKTARQIEEMKKQTIGVEVEMNSITREKAAKIAAEFFGTGRYQNTAFRNGYCTWSAWDADGREWKFQKDVSIHGPDSEKCELVTPILTYSDIETLQELIRKLRKAGAKSDATRGCGVHIHIGANGHTAQTLRNLANLMASHEKLIATALKINEGRMRQYCKTVDPNFLAKLNSKKPQTMSQLADIWYDLQTFGTRATERITAGANTTIRAATICLTSTQPLQKARLNSDFSNSMHRRTASRTDFTQDSSRVTFSFAWHSARWPKNSERQAPRNSRKRIRNSQ